MEFTLGRTKIKVVHGDITDQDTEAIVNAANSSLMGGGGVDGAIHRRGGKEILAECKEIREKQWPGGLPTGEAVITTGGKLRARYVIHTVGPVWRGGTHDEERLLRNAYRNSLKLASKRNIRSLSFPSISTGAYGFPIEKASGIAFRAVKEFVENAEHSIAEVRFILFSKEDFEIYLAMIREEMR